MPVMRRKARVKLDWEEKRQPTDFAGADSARKSFQEIGDLDLLAEQARPLAFPMSAQFRADRRPVPLGGRQDELEIRIFGLAV